MRRRGSLAGRETKVARLSRELSDAFEQQARSFRDDLHLLQEQVVKLLLAWQQSHNVGFDGENLW